MRTTLEIEEDVLLAAREIARARHITLGKAVSDLARKALTNQTHGARRNGVPLFPVREGAQVVTLALVNQLRDEAP